MIILIDDDNLMHLGWKLRAAKMNLELQCFSAIEQFIDIEQTIPRTATIYVDSNLKNNIKGENESKKLHDLGFENLYIVTGYEASNFDLEKLYWIKDIISKDPPF